MTDVWLKQLAVGPMQNFAYLVGAVPGAECVVVDPGWEASKILAAARNEGRHIIAVLLTHGHFDHVGAVKGLSREGDIPLFSSRGEDGASAVLAGLEFRFLHTPGHALDSQCILVEGQLFTGDTLFIDCCGRTDLAGSNPAQMHQSLRRLAVLPPQTVVWPGHDYGDRPSATLGEVLQMNPYLAAETLQDFLGLVA